MELQSTRLMWLSCVSDITIGKVKDLFDNLILLCFRVLRLFIEHHTRSYPIFHIRGNNVSDIFVSDDISKTRFDTTSILTTFEIEILLFMIF